MLIRCIEGFFDDNHHRIFITINVFLNTPHDFCFTTTLARMAEMLLSTRAREASFLLHMQQRSPADSQHAVSLLCFSLLESFLFMYACECGCDLYQPQTSLSRLLLNLRILQYTYPPKWFACSRKLKQREVVISAHPTAF